MAVTDPTAALTPPLSDGQALVIGGGVAGLCCAEVLARHFGRVTLLERDALPSGPAPRRGVPQSPHQHLLLARGQCVLEALFPGLGAEVAAAGTEPLDVAADLAWLTPAGWAPRFPSGITIQPCSRQLLESCLRQRVRANTRVHILEGHEVVGLLGRPGGAVVGVRARPAARRDADGEAIAASLVVDAGGRGSRLPLWLEELGRSVPPASVVDARVSYTSRIYDGLPALPEGFRGAFIQAAPPASTRGGALLPIEGRCTLLTLIGRGGDVPSTDDHGFTAFARSLRSAMIHDAVGALAPLTRPVSSRSTENRRRSYERVRDWPAGLVVVGDSAFAFNPVYGQGMSTAALGAAALGRLLDDAGADAVCRGAGRFQRRLARLCAGVWTLDTDLDLRGPGVVGPKAGRGVRVRQAYLAQLGRLAVERPEARLAFLEVLHMLRGPRSLLRPRILLPVAVRAARERVRRPAISAPTAVERGGRPAG